MKKLFLPTYIIILDILHSVILFFTYAWWIYAYITWNFLLQSIHFLHIITVAGMILYFKTCLLTDYTNSIVEKNGKSRKEFSDFTQFIFYTLIRIKISPKILWKFNEAAVIVWIILFCIVLYTNLYL